MKKLLITLLSIIYLSACGDDKTQFKILPNGPIKHQYIVMAKTKNGIRAKGFQGATPPNTPVFFEVGTKNKRVVSSAEGGFDAEIELASLPERGDLTFTINGTLYYSNYQVKDLSEKLPSVAKKPFKTDLEIDHISFQGSEATLLSSNAALVSVHHVDTTWTLNKHPSKTILLNPKAEAKLGPRMAARLGNYAVVPFFGTSELALLNLSANSLSQKSRLMDKNGALYLFENKPPLAVRHPINADGNTVSSTIARSYAHAPETIHVINDNSFLVAFTNYYQFADSSKGDKAVIGPGLIALIMIENNTLRTKDIIELPYKNPQHFVQKSATEVWISCSGSYRDVNVSPLASDGAGLAKLTIAKDKLSISHQIALTDFTPGEPAIVNNKLVIPHAWGNQIAVIEETATALTTASLKTHSYHRPFSFVLAQHWHDDIVFLTTHDGNIVAYGVAEGFFPFPFTEPMKLNRSQDKKMVINPMQLFIRDYSQTYQPGYSVWALSPSENLIIPLDLMEIFGP